jgi:YHS domain-containing protein
MIRYLIALLVSIVVITLLRAIGGLIAKQLGDFFQAPNAAGQRRRADKPGGELYQDPVCGVFVPAGASVRKEVGGKTVYFCSAACRDKFRA